MAADSKESVRPAAAEGSGSDDPPRSRYVVGIDLGTTNCAVASVDTARDPWRVETFPVAQWVDWGAIERRDTLPSFHYQPTAAERAATAGRSAATLPWEDQPADALVGVLARDAGLRHPGRRIASAKSWLSHDAVDRTAPLLPWHGDADALRLSPVEASAAYLRHIRQAWDHRHADAPLAEQEVIVTLPASFDEVARELTVRAARLAGLPRIYLIEEPQAAFYAWIDRQGDDWSARVRPGQLILVCDLGGGTTDLTLIRVRRATGGEGDPVQFHRVAVGQHLILGGDNLDLALAKYAEAKLTGGGELPPQQWDRMIEAARWAKETMLGERPPESYTISLAAEGARLIAGAQQVELSAAEIQQVLVDGFFPRVDRDARPLRAQSGFQEFGLPYAADPAVTRHLAAFLTDHATAGLEADELAGGASATRPELVLFNGGVMTSAPLRQRIVDAVADWFAPEDDPDWRPEVLRADRLDLAVAHGAAYYGMVRRGRGVRITANLGRSYYIQVDDQPPETMCVIPGSAQPGEEFQASAHPLRLQIGAPVEFPMWVSSTRMADAPGTLVAIDPQELTPLPPIRTALMRGRRRQETTLEVTLAAELSEIGTLGLFCVDTATGHRWRLDFDIRSTLETDRAAHGGAGEASGIVDMATIEACQAVIAETFGPQAKSAPDGIVRRLRSAAEMDRSRWPPSLLRSLWQQLIDHQAGRRRTAAHEARWLNLVGYALRPGYGVAVDDWRVAETWRAVHGKLAFPGPASRTESLILWRRIAGGLGAGHQSQLITPLLSALRGKGVKLQPHEATELWRLAGSLELLPQELKRELAEAALQAAASRRAPPHRGALWWALGRVASRQPVYGPLNTVLPAEVVAPWIDSLCEAPGEAAERFLPLMQIARRTGDRYRDLPRPLAERAADWLEQQGAPPHYIELVREGGSLEGAEEAALFGEALPLGIRLVR